MQITLNLRDLKTPNDILKLQSTISEIADVLDIEGVWTDYSAQSTIVGWASFSIKEIYIKKIGKTVFVAFWLDGTSNATITTFTLPYANAGTIVATLNLCDVVDNGVEGVIGMAWLPASSSTVTVYRDTKQLSPTAWTNSGTKYARGQFFYEKSS